MIWLPPVVHGPEQVTLVNPAEKRPVIDEIPELPFIWKVVELAARPGRIEAEVHGIWPTLGPNSSSRPEPDPGRACARYGMSTRDPPLNLLARFRDEGVEYVLIGESPTIR